MVLVPCYECSKEISDKASTCPGCGAPRGKGWFKDYYEDRPLRREGGHFMGERHGKYKEYLENGEVAVSGEYASGRKIGIWTSFHKNGAVWKIRQFDEDTDCENMVGEYRENYDNGQLQQRGFYHAGHRNGLWVEYHANGQVHEKVTWKDDCRHGPYEEYHRDGRLRSKGSFCMDKKCGSWTESGGRVDYKPCPGEKKEVGEGDCC